MKRKNKLVRFFPCMALQPSPIFASKADPFSGGFWPCSQKLDQSGKGLSGKNALAYLVLSSKEKVLWH